MKISYNWLQNYFEEKLPSPEKISEGIIFHAFEVEEMKNLPPLSPSDSSPRAGEQDTIFDIKILPDRAHDCLSHWGIAKELSAIFSLKIKAENYKIFKPKPTTLKIEIEASPTDGVARCLRYMGRIVRDVKIGPSPEWLKEKLEAVGQKSINNIVDAANFVMFDLGQPIHAFDLDKLESAKIIVRNAKEGEKITTLDKKEVNLDESILVIATPSPLKGEGGGEVLAIAGIKGGMKAEVNENTKNIVIEVANFNAIVIRKTAKKINILTDAVKRYENEITPELCEKAMNMMTDLVFKLAGGEAEDIIDVYPLKVEQREVAVSIEYINKRLGTSFSKEEIESVWKKLNFEYSINGNEFKIKVPYLRLDITGPHDLTEEVGRILGYNRLEEKLPEIKSEGKIDETFTKMILTRNKLLNEGYSEVMTYVFRDKGEVEVFASASDKKFLRTNLSDGLKESLKLNQINAPLLGMKEIKIFEIGNVFLKDREEMHVAYGDKKEVKEMNLEEYTSQMQENFVALPASGLRHEQNFPASASVLRSQDSSEENLNPQTFKMWSLFPFIARDIAVWVPASPDASQGGPENTSSESIAEIIKENMGELVVRGPELFDEFKKEGRISYAFRLIFQSYERTLTDEEVVVFMQKITEKLISNGFEIR